MDPSIDQTELTNILKQFKITFPSSPNSNPYKFDEFGMPFLTSEDDESDSTNSDHDESDSTNSDTEIDIFDGFPLDGFPLDGFPLEGFPLDGSDDG